MLALPRCRLTQAAQLILQESSVLKSLHRTATNSFLRLRRIAGSGFFWGSRDSQSLAWLTKTVSDRASSNSRIYVTLNLAARVVVSQSRFQLDLGHIESPCF